MQILSESTSQKRILEIGSLYGYSAILMASVMSSYDGDDGIKVVTIEIDKNNGSIANENSKMQSYWIRLN